MVPPPRTHGGQDHRLRIERLCGSQLAADIAQAFFNEARNNLGGGGRVARLECVPRNPQCRGVGAMGSFPGWAKWPIIAAGVLLSPVLYVRNSRLEMKGSCALLMS